MKYYENIKNKAKDFHIRLLIEPEITDYYRTNSLFFHFFSGLHHFWTELSVSILSLKVFHPSQVLMD